MEAKISDAKAKVPQAKMEGEPPAEQSPKPSRRWWNRKVMMLAALGVLLAGGGGGAWYVVQQRKPQSGQPEAHHKPAAKPLFTTLDLFTVNLQDAYSERVAQIGVTLQFEDPELEVTIKDRLPAVRNGILLLISSKQVDELLTIEGKEQLAQQIRTRAARSLGVEVPEPGAPAGAKAGPENPIRAVLFSHFIVQ